MSFGDIRREPTPMPRKLISTARITGVLALLFLVLSALSDMQRFLSNWLVLFLFVLTLGIGALFLVLLEYTVNATWSIPFRRISENLAALLPVSFFLGIPILFGLHTLFEWTHAEAVATDPILQKKTAYLNVPFFIARFALFYVAWLGAYFIFIRLSRRLDASGERRFILRAQRLAPAALIVFAFTLTFAAFDWVMSLDPHWYSTILGIYLMAGAMAAGTALTTLASASLKRAGMLPAAIDQDHFYNLGALLFAFNTFWGYIAFVQFLLIWYGNIPHETAWFALRGRFSWPVLTFVLVFAHFLVPFLGLLSRSAKTDLRRLSWVAAFVLLGHGVDMYWIVVPSIRHYDAVVGWQEAGIALAALSIGLFVWIRRSSQAPLLAVGDPRLKDALHFHL
jgi:hypothetical protein